MNLPAEAPAPIPPHLFSGDWLNDPTLWPDLDKLITEDETPVDNPLHEKQMRLLTEPLYASWPGPRDGRPFRVLANVGLYYTLKPLVPDVMLGLGVSSPKDLMDKGHRAWFTWIVGKVPDAVVEIVSNREGHEESNKMAEYAQMGVPCYVIYDPENLLRKGVLRGFGLKLGNYEAMDVGWLPKVELGLRLWQGQFEDVEREWLRWCDEKGQIIPTGAERAAEAEKRAARLEAQLRALGIEPS